VTGYEHHALTATRVFDIVDGFAAQRGLDGPRPRPLGRVRLFLVADRTPGAERTYPDPPELLLTTTDSGYAVSFGVVRQPDGTQHIDPFGAGPYLLRVRSDYYQVADFDGVSLPATSAQPEPYEMVLAAGYSYPFPFAATAPSIEVGGPASAALALLRGAVLAPDGSGVAGANVTAPGATSYRTGADGQWVLVFAAGVPAAGTVDVTVTAPGSGPVVVAGVAVTPGGEAALPQTALRGRITAPGAALAAAVVEIAGQPGRAGVRSDGVWAYYFSPTQAATTVTVNATLPDGRSLSVPGVQVVPRTTTTVPDLRLPRPAPEQTPKTTPNQRSTDA
jgi:hypothetical protein